MSDLITIGVLGLGVYVAYTHGWLDFLKGPTPPGACPDQAYVNYLPGVGPQVAAILTGRAYRIAVGPGVTVLTVWLQHPGTDAGQALELDQLKAVDHVTSVTTTCSHT